MVPRWTSGPETKLLALSLVGTDPRCSDGVDFLKVSRVARPTSRVPKDKTSTPLSPSPKGPLGTDLWDYTLPRT